MGWVHVGVPLLAAFLFGFREHAVLAGLSIATAFVTFWTHGVMHNVAVESARRRLQRVAENMRAEGRGDEEIDRFLSRPVSLTPPDVQVVPDGLTRANMAASLAGVLLLILSLIL